MATATPNSKLTVITPQMAAQYLAHNDKNRTLRAAKVDEYIGIIQRGEWQVTHQGIGIAKNGRLIDGQHRLHAIVKTGKAVSMFVTTGLDENAFRAIDIGAKRSPSDITGIRKERIETDTVIFDVLNGDVRWTGPQIEVIDKTFGHLADCLESICSARRKIVTSAPIRAAAVVCSALYPASAEDIMLQYRAMAMFEPSVLWPSTTALYRQTTSPSRSTPQRIETFLRAYIAFTPAKKNVSKIQIKDLDHVRDEAKKNITKLMSEEK